MYKGHDPRRVLDQLLLVTVLLGRDMEDHLVAEGLTTSRTHLLWVVHRGGPMTQKGLAEALEVTPRNVTGLVDGLQASGHVVRSPHPDDRRAVLVSLTDAGQQAMATMERQHGELATALVEGLSRGHVNALVSGLDHVTARLRELVADREATS